MRLIRCSVSILWLLAAAMMTGCMHVDGLARVAAARMTAESNLRQLELKGLNANSAELKEVSAAYKHVRESVDVWLMDVGTSFDAPGNFEPLDVSSAEFHKQLDEPLDTLAKALGEANKKAGIEADFAPSQEEVDNMIKEAERTYEIQRGRQEVRMNIVDSAVWQPIEKPLAGQMSPPWPLRYVEAAPTTAPATTGAAGGSGKSP